MLRNPNKAVFTLGPAAEILIVNKSACSLLGYQVLGCLLP